MLSFPMISGAGVCDHVFVCIEFAVCFIVSVLFTVSSFTIGVGLLFD
ncbi:MAG: hypothetical protein WCG25_08840 [bacterium]